jgi:hypothetical protein
MNNDFFEELKITLSNAAPDNASDEDIAQVLESIDWAKKTCDTAFAYGLHVLDRLQSNDPQEVTYGQNYFEDTIRGGNGIALELFMNSMRSLEQAQAKHDTDYNSFLEESGITETDLIYSRPEIVPSDNETFEAITSEEALEGILAGMKLAFKLARANIISSSSIDEASRAGIFSLRTLMTLHERAFSHKDFVWLRSEAIDIILQTKPLLESKLEWDKMHNKP